MNYGKSVNTRSIGSKATNAASSRAYGISMGFNRSHTAPQVSISPGARKLIHPGSAAGYRNEKSTFIAMNDTGYFNRTHQKARYRPQSSSTLPKAEISNAIMEKQRRPVMRTLDMRMAKSEKGSVSKLTKLLKSRG